MSSKLPYINLGCGNRFHKDWVNADLIHDHSDIDYVDLREPLPYADNIFEVVYHSNVLEHLTRYQGRNFLEECYRVLKEGGIFRILVPDLERCAKDYLASLERVRNEASVVNVEAHLWMQTELIDQCARNKSGGEMMQVIKEVAEETVPFIIDRIGNEGRQLVACLRRANSKKNDNYSQRSGNSFFKKLKNKLSRKTCLSEEMKNSLQVGNFRLGGEVHQWMYDSFSLHNLLDQIGFKNIRVLDHYKSGIIDFSKYLLDVDLDGNPNKPDSLVIEASK